MRVSSLKWTGGPSVGTVVTVLLGVVGGDGHVVGLVFYGGAEIRQRAVTLKLSEEKANEIAGAVVQAMINMNVQQVEYIRNARSE